MEKTKKLSTIATALVGLPALICCMLALAVLFRKEETINVSALSWTILGCTILFAISLCCDIYLCVKKKLHLITVLFAILLILSSYTTFGLLNLIGLHPVFWLSYIMTILAAFMTLFTNAFADK